MSAKPVPAADTLMWRVRAMTPSDLEGVVAIEQAVYPFPWTIGNFADSLRAGYDAWLFEHLALDAGNAGLLGYAVVMWLPDEVHLLNLSVAAAWQRMGVGARMLRWLMGDARDRGAAAMMLEVRPSNEPARRLYAAHDFTQIGVRRRYYPAPAGTREDALVLARGLNHG
jgi:ribosomal-protein-alanine N-acetyltransferase